MKTTIRYVLTLAALLLSSSSYADYYGAQSSSGSSTLYACDAYQACNRLTSPSHVVSAVPSGSFCLITNANGSTNNGPLTRYFGNPPISQIPGGCPSSCPSGEEFDEYNKCVPVGCPDGQFMEAGQCQHACVAGFEKKMVIPMPQIQFDTIDPILGCDMKMSQTKKPECNANTLMCNVYYVDQGTYNDDFSLDPQYEPLPEITPPPEATSSQTVEGPVTTTETNPDGSVTTTETTQITQLNDQGQTVEIIGDSIVLKNKDGEIVDILQQTTYNSYTDGSSQIIETITTTATPNTVTEVKKNLTDGSTSVTTRTYSSGKSGTTVTTKTENFDSTGKSTGSTQVTDGKINDTGEGEGDDEKTDYQMPTGKGDFDDATTEMQQKIAQAKQDLSDKLEQIKTEASQLIDFNQSGTGSLPCTEEIVDDIEIRICATDYEDELSNLGNLIFFAFSILALFILLR